MPERAFRELVARRNRYKEWREMGAASLHLYPRDRELLVINIAVATLLAALVLLAFAATLGAGMDGVFVADSSWDTSPFRWRDQPGA